MLRENQEFNVKITKTNVEWYRSRGYNCNLKDNISVLAEDLTLGNGQNVLIICDYCGNEYTRGYGKYIKDKNNRYIQKNACNNCEQKRREETNLIKYGTKNVFQNEEVRERFRKNSLLKYGCEYPHQSEVVKNNIIKNNIEKYGCEFYFQTDEFKDKYKDTMIEKYGVDNSFKSEEVKEKIKATNLEKYGVEYIFQSEEYRQRQILINREKYGVDNYAQTDEFKIKYKNTINERYGVDHYSQTDEYNEKIKNISLDRYGVEHFLKDRDIQNKCIETNKTNHNGLHHTQTEDFMNLYNQVCMEKYGVPWAMQNPEIKERANQTMYSNGSAPCSRQQKYLHYILGGEINYPVGTLFLDIAFVKNNVVLEYDGGFHNGQVKLGNISQEEFDKKEMNRNYFLKRRGWRIIRLISKKDYLPEDEIIKNIIEHAISYLNSGHTWINIDIDNSLVINSQGLFDFDYGKLRQITDKDLDRVS
jgi:hypothetical protein